MVHKDLVGLYLSAILQLFCTEACVVFVFVLCRFAAAGPSISFELASTSGCALQSAVHCRTLHEIEDERMSSFSTFQTPSGCHSIAYACRFPGQLIAGRGACEMMQDIR